MATVKVLSSGVSDNGITVTGGFSLIADAPKDLNEMVQAYRGMADRSSEGASASRFVDWVMDFKDQELPPPAREYSPDDDGSGDDDFTAAMRLVAESWFRHTGDWQEGDGWRALVSAAESETSQTIQINAARTAWVLHRGGSIGSVLMGGPYSLLRAAGFAVTFYRRGVSAAAVTEALVERTRNRAEERGAYPLERIDDLRPKYLNGCRDVVLLLHGLLSTDLGTFDPLPQQLKEQDITVLGWPHDSTKGVEVNAAELIRLLVGAFAEAPPDARLVMVGHSRGGLLAREINVQLQTHQQWRWRVRGAMTFGSPHLGARLADTPEKMLGRAIFLLASRQSGSVLDALDTFYALDRKSIPGVEDLREATRESDYLHRLTVREQGLSEPLTLRAWGGDASVLANQRTNNVRARRFLARLASTAIGDEMNDLVVRVKSAIPRWPSVTGHHVKCTHFDYFEVDSVVAKAIEEVAALFQ